MHCSFTILFQTDNLTISLFYSILLHRKPFLPDHLHHLIHILRAQLITLCLNHHTDHRLRTALTQKDSSILTQSGADPILFHLHTRIAGNRSQPSHSSKAAGTSASPCTACQGSASSPGSPPSASMP